MQELKARVDIKKGEGITISYVDTILPTPIRRRELLKDKRFRCECRRCRHRTELARNDLKHLDGLWVDFDASLYWAVI